MNRREKLQQSSLSEIFPSGSDVIVHPGCDAALFSFPAFPQPDPANPAETVYGMPACLVLDACRALTNYAAKSGQDFFARDRAGKEQVPIRVDCIDVLHSGCYYYFLGPPTTVAHVKYPIVKEFAALTFPGNIPRHWSRATTGASSPLLMAAREQCPNSEGPNDPSLRLDIAAFIPPSEVDWFTANEMQRFSPCVDADAGPADDPANWITLRTDLRDILYAHGYVLYPTGDGEYAAFFLDTAHLAHAAAYHRRRARIHVEVADAFVYARFAYAAVHLPRCDDLFEGVPVPAAVKRAREMREMREALETAVREHSHEWIEQEFKLLQEWFGPGLQGLGQPPIPVFPEKQRMQMLVAGMKDGDPSEDGGTGTKAA